MVVVEWVEGTLRLEARVVVLREGHGNKWKKSDKKEGGKG